MLTVISFRARDDDRAILLALGRALNATRPGLFDEDGFKPRHRGFGCDVEDSAVWLDHVQRVIDYLEECGEIFARAAKVGIVIKLDTAIWPEDRAALGQVRLTFSAELMAALGAAGAHLLVSDYVGLVDRDPAYLDELDRDD